MASLAAVAERQVSSVLPDETVVEATFRARARAWLAEACSPRTIASGGIETESEGVDSPRVLAAQRFQRNMYEAGFAGLSWPRCYGGQGLGLREEVIFAEEASPYLIDNQMFKIGLDIAGPVLLEHGTDNQRESHLSRILSGEVIWAQLFSEPDAGSDLAAVRTSARLDGNGWVVNGQKVWTSGGAYSDLGLLLARTAPDKPRHAGLSMFIVGMTVPGVEVRPLRQMTGGARFCEVFLRDVRLPSDALVGPVNQGWRCALGALTKERVSISGPESARRAGNVSALIALARRRGLAGDPQIRAELADVWIDEQVLGWVTKRAVDEQLAGVAHSSRGSIGKLLTTRLQVRSSRLGVGLGGPGALAWDSGDGDARELSQRFLFAPGMSIGGGTDEVQRTILAERVLGLPRESSR